VATNDDEDGLAFSQRVTLKALPFWGERRRQARRAEAQPAFEPSPENLKVQNNFSL
jgi:hypothetical protein